MTPLFNHRHYVEMARIINLLPDEQMRRTVAYHFCEKLQDSNIRFNPLRFFHAAMGEPINSRDMGK